MNLESIIGLEIHIQLKTKSKMFCSCSNNGENEPPNTTVCPICLGHPGALPVVNQVAVKMGVKMALSLDCSINQESIWERKNYFYPDLAKGYQISQFEKPLAESGQLTIESKKGPRQIGINRLHLEEDAAKNFHGQGATLVDFNRAGTPLAEIVTEPDLRTPLEAKVFLQELRLLAVYLGVSDADMEKGHLRCDANISLRSVGDNKLYPKTEIKNLNSFKFVERALEYEIKRQTELWQKGQPPKTESTRGWDEKNLKTVAQRSKEDSADYRYFPEPDLLPLIFNAEAVAGSRSALPELPQAKRQRFVKEYGLALEDAKVLAENQRLADYFEKVMMEARSWLESLENVSGTAEEIWQQNQKRLVKLVSGWLTSELFKLMNQANLTIEEIKITPENFAEFIALVYEGKINSSAAQLILAEMFASGQDPSDIMQDQDLGQLDDLDALSQTVEQIIKNNPEQTAQYRQGKTPLMKYFLGQAMKATKGKANPELLEELFLQQLK